MKKVLIFGSTGSIGRNTIEVIGSLSGYRIVGMAAFANYRLLIDQVKESRPRYVAIYKKKFLPHLKRNLHRIKLFDGEEGLWEMTKESDADIIVFAFASAIGMDALIEGIKRRMRICLATKEVLVSFGEIMMDLIRQYKTELIPIDSEHSAIYQCLEGKNIKDVESIILTASGGPFLNKPIENVTIKDVLNHPIWNMGKKITVDSATMINKGLEIIEAHHLFKIPVEKIKVLIHPEAICHSLVQLIDGSVFAQMSVPDMRLPIQYALTKPERRLSLVKSLDLSKIRQLNFLNPDLKKFPALKLAYKAIEVGKSMPAVLNGANEAAVKLFLSNQIKFTDIPNAIRLAMANHKPKMGNIEDYRLAEDWARELVKIRFSKRG